MIWTALADLIAGPFLGKALDAWKAKLDKDGAVETNADRLAADLAGREIEARKALALAELGSWFTALPRWTIEMAVAVYVGKVLVVDKVLGLGSTDAIGGAVGAWAEIVMVGMFGTTVATRVVAGLMRR